MSIALDMKVATLDKRVTELEQHFGGMTRQDLLAHLAQLELRIEQLEQKRGAKAKESNG
jgi:BMFP domain-containing protein YqiC